MTARDEAITKAAEAIANSWSIPLSAVDPHVTNDARLALAAALPVLLNDLADRIEFVGTGDENGAWSKGMLSAVLLVRAAAEGWGA